MDPIAWIRQDDRNYWTAVAVTVLFIVLSLLGIILPGVAKKAAIADAQTAYTDAFDLYNATNNTVALQQVWFASEYFEGIGEKQYAAYDLIVKSDKNFSEASSAWSLDNAIEYATLAKKDADEAYAILTEVKLQLDENDRIRREAMSALEDASDKFDAATTTLASGELRYDTENDQWLTKYMEPLGENISSATGAIQNARAHIDAAQAVMPALDSASQIGDPIAAIAELDQAKIQIDTVNSLMDQVTGGLDYQIKAKAQATPTIQQAAAGVPNALSHINEIVRTRGYSLELALAMANSLYLQSVEELTLAQEAIATQLEGGKIDFPLAYESALSAIDHANAAYSEVDRQVSLEDTARAKIAEFDATADFAAGLFMDAGWAYDTLEANHAYGAYSDLDLNLVTAQNYLVDASVSYDAATSLVSRSRQRFEEADAEIQFALDRLAQASALSSAIIDRSSTLEYYRGEWPTRSSNAYNTIEAERSQVNTYGSYDSSAQSDFNAAVDLYNEAVRYATDRYFQIACEKADEANTLAMGTGDEAEDAYDDYVREQEEARRRAEEEAQRQAEEAQRQAQEDSSPSIDSGDSGSCCESGGGDGGDIGGGDSGDGGDW